LEAARAENPPYSNGIDVKRSEKTATGCALSGFGPREASVVVGPVAGCGDQESPRTGAVLRRAGTIRLVIVGEGPEKKDSGQGAAGGLGDRLLMPLYGRSGALFGLSTIFALSSDSEQFRFR